MNLIEPPLIVVDRGGDVSFFDTVVDAVTDLEAIDVEANEYRAFDAAGRKLRLSFGGLTKFKPGWVNVQTTEDAPSGGEELRGLLIDFGARSGGDRSRLEGLGLQGLIETVRPK